MSSRAIVLSPLGPLSLTCAPSVISGMAPSAEGTALMTLPPMVATLRIWTDPMWVTTSSEREILPDDREGFQHPVGHEWAPILNSSFWNTDPVKPLNPSQGDQVLRADLAFLDLDHHIGPSGNESRPFSVADQKGDGLVNGK